MAARKIKPVQPQEQEVANNTSDQEFDPNKLTSEALNKLDLASLKALLDRANEAFTSRKTDELKTLVNGWLMKAEKIGYTLSEVIDEIKSRLPAPAAKNTALKETKEKKRPESMDHEGKMPEVGRTYRLDDGMEWTKKSKGANKGEFVIAILAGQTWAELAENYRNRDTPKAPAAAPAEPQA